QLPPAFEILAVDRAFRAELHDKVALLVFGDYPNGVGASCCAKLDGERAEAAGSTPNEDVMARAKDVRPVPEQHAVSGRHGQRITGALLPGEMEGSRHELAILDAGELGKRAVRGLVAPNALGRREHWIAAIAFLIVAIVLVAVHDNLVANLPAFDF